MNKKCSLWEDGEEGEGWRKNGMEEGRGEGGRGRDEGGERRGREGRVKGEGEGGGRSIRD